MTRSIAGPERELACPICRTPPLPVYPTRCVCGWEGKPSDTIVSGRKRDRQFPPGKYPMAAPFR